MIVWRTQLGAGAGPYVGASRVFVVGFAGEIKEGEGLLAGGAALPGEEGTSCLGTFGPLPVPEALAGSAAVEESAFAAAGCLASSLLR
eukprot:gene14201-14344_t